MWLTFHIVVERASQPDAATRWRMASLISGAAAIAGTIVRDRLGGCKDRVSTYRGAAHAGSEDQSESAPGFP